MGDPVPAGAERNVFGANSTYHEVTGMPLETGIGALPADKQADLHVGVIHQRHGKAAADEMRAKLDAYRKVKSDEDAAVKIGAPLPEPAPSSPL
jgi:hypothetical protein